MSFDGLNVEELLTALKELTSNWEQVTVIFRQEGCSDRFRDELQKAVDAGAQLSPISDWTLPLKDKQDRRPFDGMTRQKQEDVLAEITNLWEEVVILREAQRLRKVHPQEEESHACQIWDQNPFLWVLKMGLIRGLIKTVFPELNHQ
ncbi:hypothetical protein MK805_12660 [Shimazuella sp. AN120528]|uniref:hypothetical protein n=1 Tax=Shimazuella soli TaxID=1892854 RepID=UPI001F0DAE30|nr:hypothetical protein [Shimazuella soli]MCH5585795.1 hypothetical protein [Shimazuella soli]